MIRFPPTEIIKQFKETPGAMSVSEGIALYNICLQAPKGEWMELGSHRGKSTTMIAATIPANSILQLVEPEFSNKEWLNYVVEKINNLSLSFVEYYADISINILPQQTTPLSFLFVDSGNHGEEIVQSEKPLYENNIISGGIIAFHDLFSQFTAVTRCYEQLIATGNYEPIPIDWQPIIDYVRENNLEEGNNSWHLYPEHPFPNFVGALKRK